MGGGALLSSDEGEPRIPLCAGGSKSEGQWRREFAAGGDAAYRALLEHAGQQIGQDDDSDASLLLRRALEQIEGDFETRVWQAFWRTAVDGLTAVEAAKQLGMTPAAVRQTKRRVLLRLREIFGHMLT